MALTADRNTLQKEGIDEEIPVAASTTIYAGSLVVTNTSGYAVEAVNTASYLMAGVSLAAADNSSGSNGDINVKVRRKGVFLFAMASAAATDIGKTVYPSDGGTVTTTAGNGVVIGKIVKVESSTSVWVDIDQR
ncbi:MAG: hypothetical protein AB1847_16680 [bacterium]